MNEDQARVGAEWWARTIQKPMFSALSPEERRSGQTGGVEVAESWAIGLATQHPVSPAMAVTFAEELSKRLLADSPLCIMSDYGPDRMLREAAECAGISPHSFPWKTQMYFRDGGVQVSLGYGGRLEELIPDKGVANESRYHD